MKKKIEQNERGRDKLRMYLIAQIIIAQNLMGLENDADLKIITTTAAATTMQFNFYLSFVFFFQLCSNYFITKFQEDACVALTLRALYLFSEQVNLFL